MHGVSCIWTQILLMVPRTKLFRQYGMPNLKTARKKFKGHLLFGATTSTIKNYAFSAVEKWCGGNTLIDWLEHSKLGFTLTRTLKVRCACMCWPSVLLRTSWNVSTLMRWSSYSSRCVASAWTDFACISRPGKNRTSTISSFSNPIWWFLGSKRRAINLCWKLASMPCEWPKRKKKWCWCKNVWRVIVRQRSKVWTSLSRKRLKRQCVLGAAVASTQSRKWSIARSPNTLTSGSRSSSDRQLW